MEEDNIDVIDTAHQARMDSVRHAFTVSRLIIWIAASVPALVIATMIICSCGVK